jgi:hypothetical protein
MSSSEHTRLVAVHQPNFLPWLGFFYKWRRSDLFVFYDDVQFVRRSIINRVRIKSPRGAQWLTLPVKQKGRYDQAIMAVEIDNERPWQKKMLGSLHACYARAPYFDPYIGELEAMLFKEYRLLVDLNLDLLSWLAALLGIAAETVRSSQLPGVTGSATDRLVSVCRAVGASAYLSGFGGMKYQDPELFKQNNIRLEIYDFSHPVYPQQWPGFIPGSSALDLLFNCGPGAKEIIAHGLP